MGGIVYDGGMYVFDKDNQTIAFNIISFILDILYPIKI